MNCETCGATMYRYGGRYYCPNCDEKPFLDGDEKENKGEKPNYVG